MTELLEPTEVTITDQKGNERNYILSKFPAIAGREIVTKYPTTNIPNIGEYQQSEEVMLKLLAFVAVPQSEGPPLRLTTRALVDNHVPDWETLAKLEWKQLEYNTSFFGNGPNSDFFGSIGPKAAAWISKILIPLLQQSSQTAKPASTNSKPDTR